MTDKKIYGATGADWDNCLRNGLLPDLLPVVSSPHATIAPTSALKTIGKVPSRYYSGKVGGIARSRHHHGRGGSVAPTAGLRHLRPDTRPGRGRLRHRRPGACGTDQGDG